jgi:tetratricopeptide (TPR) repeat protein
LGNFDRMIALSHDFFRTYKSKLFTEIWVTVRAMHMLPVGQDGDDEAAEVIRVFHSLVDLIEQSEDDLGFVTQNVVPLHFLDDLWFQAKRMLGQKHAVVYQLWLLRIYAGLEVHRECVRLVDDESRLDDLRLLFPGGVVPPPMSAGHDEAFVDDSVRGVRYSYALGLVYTEAGLLEEAEGALLCGLRNSATAEHDDSYLQARSDYALSDLFLCRSRIWKALARVSLRQGKHERALVYLDQARTLELTHADVLKLPEDYLPALDEFYSGEGLMDHDDIPGQYWEAVALFVEARASVIPAKEGLQLVALGITFFDDIQWNKDTRVFKKTAEHLRNLLVQKRFRMKVGALPEAFLLERLDAHLEYVRDVRLQEVRCSEYSYLPVLRQAVNIMGFAGKNNRVAAAAGVVSPDILTVMRDSAQFVLAKYLHSVHPPKEMCGFHAVAADAYQVLADAYYGLGDMGGFLKNAYTSQYARLVASADGVIDPAKTENEARLAGVYHKLIIALVAQKKSESEQMAETLYSLAKGFDALQTKQPQQEESEVPRLCMLARSPARETIHTSLKRFHLLLKSTEMEDALSEVSKQILDARNPEGGSIVH